MSTAPTTSHDTGPHTPTRGLHREAQQPVTQQEGNAAQRLRTTFVPVRLAFTWLGVRKTLAPEQRTTVIQRSPCGSATNSCSPIPWASGETSRATRNRSRRLYCTIRNSSSLFADDYVQVLIQPANGPVVSLAVNAAGTVHVVPENATVTTAVTQSDRGWTVEAAMPFRDMGRPVPVKGTTWRTNFVRARRGSGFEMSSWSRVEEALADDRAFGECRF